MEAMQGGSENAYSLTLFEDTDCEYQSYGPSETSGLDTQSNDGCEPSTSGCSSSQSTPATVSEKGCNPNTVETSNYEATLDPATRLALIRKRKQRSTAAARLDNTLSGFVDWVKESDQRKQAEMNARDKEDILFQKEVINNLRVASTSLQRLTQFLTDTGSEYSVGKDKKNPKPWYKPVTALVLPDKEISHKLPMKRKLTQRQISVTQLIQGIVLKRTVMMRGLYLYLVPAKDLRD